MFITIIIFFQVIIFKIFFVLVQPESLQKFKDSASNDKYPLYNALFHVFQMIQSSKSNDSFNIVLCTCRDNPCLGNSQERRRIEQLVATLPNLKTELIVVGLSDSWNGEIFYKNLQIISETFNKDNYKKLSLSDLEHTILSPARTTSTVMWKFTSNIIVPVSFFNLISS